MVEPLLLLTQVAVLVLMIIPGFLLAKFHLVSKDTGKAISNLILYVAQVALLIAGFCSVDFNTDVLIRMLAVAILATVSHLLFFFLAKLVYRRAEEGKRRVLIFSTVFTNAGYMGIPLMVALFSLQNPEVAVYGSVYVSVFNIFVWSLGAYLYTDEKNYISFKKMFLNPATIATLVGLVIFFSSAVPGLRDGFIVPVLRDSKSVVASLLNNLKGLVAPLSMLIIGFRLTELKPKDAIKDKYLYLNIFVGLLLSPSLVFGVLKLISVLGIYHDPLTASVLMLSASAPAATATSMFAEKFDGDSVYAGLIVSVTSILCVATMPLICALTYFY